MRNERLTGRGRWRAMAAGTALVVTGLGPVLGTGVAQAATSPASSSGAGLTETSTLPGVSISPSPGTTTASPTQEFSFQGVTASSIPDIKVTGSSSGAHRGRWVVQSSGHGATWIPDQAFTPGESVTITSSEAVADSGKTVHYTVDRPAPNAAAIASAAANEGTDATTSPSASSSGSRANAVNAPAAGVVGPTDTDPTQLAAPTSSPTPYVTQPGLHPPAENVAKPTGGVDPGNLFTTPLSLAGMPADTQTGTEISDNNGQVRWFQSIPTGALDLHVVTNYPGQSGPTLIYHKNASCAACSTTGSWIAMNEHYQVVGTINALDGLQPDGHDIAISPNGEYALIEAYNPITVNATSVGGPSNLLVLEGVIQEIDISTNALVAEWHSLGTNPANGEQYVPLQDSFVSPQPAPPQGTGGTTPVDDYIHINSLGYLPGSNSTIVFSARHISAVYELNLSNYYVNWRFGGKDTRNQITETDGDGGDSFAHDLQVVTYNAGTGAMQLSLFDNGVSRTPASSRGVLFTMTTHVGGGTATVEKNWVATNADAAHGSDGHVYGVVTGSNRLEGNGDQLVGYGSSGYADEFTPGGAVDFASELESGPPAGSTTPVQSFSYRTLRYDNWVGQPLTTPAYQISEPTAGTVNVAVSWNGDTQVTQWALYAGASATNLTMLRTVPWSGFETDVSSTIPPGDTYFQVRALNAAGTTLANGTTPASQDPIAAEYASPGVATALGSPTSGEMAIGAGGLYQTYQYGNIYWSAATGAHEVQGVILQKYSALGGPTGLLGFPISDEQAAGVANSGGRKSLFQVGDIFFSPGTGAFEVQGVILSHYLALGGAAGVLGFPVSDEKASGPANVGGRESDFQVGNVYFSPSTGAYEVQGVILAHYLQLGGPSSVLGFPTSDEEASSGGGRQNTFQIGDIFFSGGTGALEVQGAILSTYLSLGGPGSYLGFPTSDEFSPSANIRQSNFQNGHYIQYSFVTNQITVH